MNRKRFDPLLIFPVVLALLLFVLEFTLPQTDTHLERSSQPSSFSKHRDGLKGLYLVLEQLGKEPKRWFRPYPLLKNEAIGTLIVANPKKELSPKEKEALKNWFAKGGQMVLMHKGKWKIKASGYNQKPISFIKIFEDEPNLTLIKKQSLLTNFALKESPGESVAIIQQILSHPGPVYFDEYHLNNGKTTSPWTLIKQYFQRPLGWVTLHLIVVFLFCLLLTPKSVKTINKRDIDRGNLILARASFLKEIKAKEFAEQMISRIRSANHGKH